MRQQPVLRALLQVVIMTAFLSVSGFRLSAAEVNVALTNWSERYITNLIDVRMPRNVFINVYRTNFLEQKHTNFVRVISTNTVEVTQFRTNVINAFATNTVEVKQLRTNTITAYHTNLHTVPVTNQVGINAWQTNVVTAYRTNWHAVSWTNEIPLERTQTNFLTAYRTNWKTLNITNWEPVLVMKTNWISEKITNVVQIELTTNRYFATEVGATKPGSEPKLASAPASVSLPSSKLSNDLTIQAATTGRFSTNNQPEVQLDVRWATDPSLVLHVQQWRVEREDGAVLCFGQESVFRRALPVGKYRIEVKAQRDASSPLLAARGTLDLKTREAVLQPLVVRK